MKFQSRLNKFLLGVIIGLVLVVMFFGGRDWLSWLPGPQVKGQINEWYQSPSEEVSAALVCSGFSDELLSKVMTDGDVDFGNSDPRGTPRMYWVGYESEDLGHVDVSFEIDGEEARIVDFRPKKDCP